MQQRAVRVARQRNSICGERHCRREGQATFERILDATARLLDEVGTEGISTNLIAKAAGVNVATLYQYFPNKQAVLLALFQRQSDQRIDIGESMVEGLGGSRDWRRVLGEAIDAIADLRRSEPGATALRQAMRSSPDLLAHDVQGNLHAARRLADELVDAGAATPEEAKLVARCTMEVLTSLLDMWAVESGGRDNRIVEQVKAMLEGYLAPYLEPPHAGVLFAAGLDRGNGCSRPRLDYSHRVPRRGPDASASRCDT